MLNLFLCIAHPSADGLVYDVVRHIGGRIVDAVLLALGILDILAVDFRFDFLDVRNRMLEDVAKDVHVQVGLEIVVRKRLDHQQDIIWHNK